MTTKDEALAALEEMARAAFDHVETMGDDAEFSDMRAADATVSAYINERPREVDDWVPVAERLPEMNETVWVALTGGVTDTDHMCGDGDWRDYYGQVTHWRPLPAPPKEETESKPQPKCPECGCRVPGDEDGEDDYCAACDPSWFGDGRMGG